MLNKKVLLGSLVAGAFLLPMVATAGVVNGPCSSCHTMHNSQDGTNMNADSNTNDKLLGSAGTCAGCHARGVGNGANGLAVSGLASPQVDDSSDPLAAGYFTTVTGENANNHNVTDIWAGADGTLTAAPGGTLLDATFDCQDCHTDAGHHTSTAGSYRMLPGTNNTTGAANYGVDTADTDGIGRRDLASYDATGMNTLCAYCHPGFHGTNQGSAPTWQRHPTDITMTGAGPSIIQTYNATNDVQQVPVGDDGTDNNVVMCISCHTVHGGLNDDLLAFQYNSTVNAAGGSGAADTGCETCHSYSGAGM